MREKRKLVAAILGVMVAVPIVGCTKGGANGEGYMAPRNLGESMETWAGEQPPASCDVSGLPNNDPKYCEPGHLEAIATVNPCYGAFVGLVDLDYDYREVFESKWNAALGKEEVIPADYQTVAKGGGVVLTKIRIRRVIETYWNVIGSELDDVYYYGLCDEKGHCRLGFYSMPLWSGVNLVSIAALCFDKGGGLWRLVRAYPVEGDQIYDYFGKSGDFEPIRKVLMEECSRWEGPLEPDLHYCSDSPPPAPTPTEPENTSDFDMVPIPLPE